MAEDKPFPPSSQKLAKLREDGLFPYSQLLTNASCIIGLAVGVKFAWSAGGSQFVTWTKAMFSASSQLSSDESIRNLEIVGFVYLKTLAIVAFFTLAIGLLQTRMFISLKLRRPKTGVNRRLSGPRHLLATIFLLTLFCLVSAKTFLSAWTSQWSVFPKFGTFPDAADTTAATSLKPSLFLQLKDTIGASNEKTIIALFQDYRLYGIGIICFFIVIGIASRIIASAVFRHDHQMSRAEVEAEAAEDEIPEQIRNARSNLE